MFPVIGGFLLLLCLSDVLCNLLQQLFSLRRQATNSVNLYVKDNIISREFEYSDAASKPVTSLKILGVKTEADPVNCHVPPCQMTSLVECRHQRYRDLASFLLKMISRVSIPGCVLLKNGIRYFDSDFTVP